MQELTKKGLVETVAKSLEGKDLSQQAVGVLRRSTDKVLERIRQNVDAQVKEDSYPVIQTFCQNIASKLSAISQQWVDGASNDLAVFPEGTRYIFRDGEYSTVVVEQPPQNRHVNINGVVHMLAMPYVQFIIPFKSNFLTSLHVSMTRKPISDLDGLVYQPVLPNISNHFVCMGDDFWRGGADRRLVRSDNLDSGLKQTAEQVADNINEKIERIIGNFWQSQFTSDASENMQLFLKNNKIENLKAWQEKSKVDPTFVLRKDTKYTAGRTIRAFLVSDKGGKNGSLSLVNNLKSEIMNAVVAIGGDLQKLLTKIDMKTENRDKPHIEVLQEVLKEVIVQAYDELWEFLQQQLQAERIKLQAEMKVAANKLKKDFKEYMQTMQTIEKNKK